MHESLKKALPLLALILALGASLAACSKKEAPAANASATPQASASDTNSAAPPAGKQADDAVEQKLSLYIGCYNSLDGMAHRSIDRYTSWVKDMKTGPTGHEMNVYGLYAIDPQAVGACKQKFTQAAGLAPALATLDADGKTYIQSLDALSSVVQDAHTYYDRGDYKDDHFAKGKQLHPQLVERMQAFLSASKQFSDELDRQNDKAFEARMQQVEKTQGRKLPYLEMATMHAAKQLVGVIQAETFDVGTATEKTTAYEKLADEIRGYANAHQNEKPVFWSRFDQTSEDFLKAAKERVRRVRDATPYTAGEKMNLASPGASWMVEGSQGKVIKAYNDLVNASNALQ